MYKEKKINNNTIENKTKLSDFSLRILIKSNHVYYFKNFNAVC